MRIVKIIHTKKNCIRCVKAFNHAHYKGESYFSITAQESSTEHGMYRWAVLIGQSASEGLAGQLGVKIIIIIIIID